MDHSHTVKQNPTFEHPIRDNASVFINNSDTPTQTVKIGDVQLHLPEHIDIPISSKQQHRINVQTETIVRYDRPSETVTVRRNEEKKFQCVRCPKNYPVANNLQRHAKTCYFSELGGKSIVYPADRAKTLTPIPQQQDQTMGPADSDTNEAPIYEYRDQNMAPIPNTEQKFHSTIKPADEQDYGPSHRFEESDSEPDEIIEVIGIKLPDYNPAKYTRIPDTHTVTAHDTCNLPALGIVINTLLKVVICLDCARAVEYDALVAHIQMHLRHVEIPDDLGQRLQLEFGLVKHKEILYYNQSIPPVFGVDIESRPMYFCKGCHKGYSDIPTLRSHRGTRDGCKFPGRPENHYQAYAQMVVTGARRRFYAVDIDKMATFDASSTSYLDAFEKFHPPATDYSRIVISTPEDELNQRDFFYREKWLDLVKLHRPDAVQDACRVASSEELDGQAIRKAAVRYLSKIQPCIDESQQFGLLRSLSTVSPAQQTYHIFGKILKESVDKYARVLYTLIFSIVRSSRHDWENTVEYPTLDQEQGEFITLLMDAIEDGNESKIDEAFHRVCFTLFAHRRTQYEGSKSIEKFFSPVNNYVVYRSLHPSGQFRKASDITQIMAALLYCIRTTMMFETLEVARQQQEDVFKVVKEYQVYTQTEQETPFAFIYNAYRFMTAIRSHEFNEEGYTFTSVDGRELSHEGHIVHLDDIRRMHDEELDRYHSFVKENIFFGETPPTELVPQYKIEDLYENMQNHSPGYTFIDDPKNPFLACRTNYGRWLLSDLDRAKKYVYFSDEKLVWKAAPAYELLSTFQKARDILIVPVSTSGGAMPRGSELARGLYRNNCTSSRNLMLLYHVPSLTTINDKTSHRTMKDKFVPHVPTRESAEALINNLALFRPFEEFIAEQILDEAAVNRYRYQIWPQIKRTMSGDYYGDLLGEVTIKYLGKPYRAGGWRHLVTAFSRMLPDLKTYEMSKEFHMDAAMMHSTELSTRIYGRNTSQYSSEDSRATIGCIRVGIAWHSHVNIGQARPWNLDEDSPQGIKGNVGMQSDDIKITPALTKSISLEIEKILAPKLRDLTRETLMNSMAEFVSNYLPPPPPRLDSNNLRQISQISVHPARLAHLREFLRNSTARFTCPEQSIILELMIQGRQSILGILGTGRGKTTMILMYAKMYAGYRTTIVILPLSGLQGDFHRRAADQSVSITRWDPSGKFNPDAQIIYVAIEYLCFEGFDKYLRTLENTERLGLIVFDEIHKMMTDINYREAFSHFNKLQLVRTVILGLSASIPPHLIPLFFELTKTTWYIVRTPSARKELRHKITITPRDRLVETAASYISNAITTYAPQDRAIVFCKTKISAQQVAKALEIQEYTSETTNTNEDTMAKWLRGSSKVIVATSILGCGLDYASIRDVVHVDLAYTMIDQYQEESRGGRDGKAANAVTFVPQETTRPRSVPKVDEGFGTKELSAWSLEQDQCRRVTPSLFLDGISVDCMSLLDSELCDYCESQQYVDPSDSKPSKLPVRRHEDETSVSFSANDPGQNQYGALKRKIPDATPDSSSKRARSISIRQNESQIPRIAQSPSYVNWSSSPTRYSSSSSPTHNTSPGQISVLSSQTMSRTFKNAASAFMPAAPPISPSKIPRSVKNNVRSMATFSNPPMYSSMQKTAQYNPSVHVSNSHVSHCPHPSGVMARVDQTNALALKDEYDGIVQRIHAGLKIFQQRCAICLINGKLDTHPTDSCREPIASNAKDPGYSSFKSIARLPSGWCFYCMLHSKTQRHQFRQDGTKCAAIGIISRTVYSLRLRFPHNACAFFPARHIYDDPEEYAKWAMRPVDDSRYSSVQYINAQRLFLWVCGSLDD